VLRHHEQSLRARARRRLLHAHAVLAMQEIVEAGLVGRMDRHPLMPRLLEVEDPSGADLV